MGAAGAVVVVDGDAAVQGQEDDALAFSQLYFFFSVK